MTQEEINALLGTFEERKAQKLAAVDHQRASLLAAGYSHDFGGGYGVKVLQTRNTTDQIAWLTSQAAYSAAVASGQGAVLGATFRPEDNSTVVVTYAEGLAALLGMAAWGAAIYQNSWALKDAIAGAADQAVLDAIDIETGWP